MSGSAVVLQSGLADRPDDGRTFQKVATDREGADNALRLHADVTPPASGTTVTWSRGWLTWQAEDGPERARIIEWFDDRKRWLG